jgi:hypothetical protein
LTKTEAEAELRRMMLRDRAPQVGDEITFATAAELMLREASGHRLVQTR